MSGVGPGGVMPRLRPAPPGTSMVTGHGCADVDCLPPRPPLRQRVDLAAIATWQADQERARAAYYRLTNSRAKHGDP